MDVSNAYNERSSADSCVSQRFMIKTETKGISKRLIIYVLLANCYTVHQQFPHHSEKSIAVVEKLAYGTYTVNYIYGRPLNCGEGAKRQNDDGGQN